MSGEELQAAWFDSYVKIIQFQLFMFRVNRQVRKARNPDERPAPCPGFRHFSEFLSKSLTDHLGVPPNVSETEKKLIYYVFHDT